MAFLRGWFTSSGNDSMDARRDSGFVSRESTMNSLFSSTSNGSAVHNGRDSDMESDEEDELDNGGVRVTAEIGVRSSRLQSVRERGSNLDNSVSVVVQPGDKPVRQTKIVYNGRNVLGTVSIGNAKPEPEPVRSATTQIMVQNFMNSRTADFTVPKTGTVEDLMRLLAQKWGIPVEQQRLTYAGRNWERGEKLQSYSEVKGDCVITGTVLLQGRLRGG